MTSSTPGRQKSSSAPPDKVSETIETAGVSLSLGLKSEECSGFYVGNEIPYDHSAGEHPAQYL